MSQVSALLVLLIIMGDDDYLSQVAHVFVCQLFKKRKISAVPSHNVGCDKFIEVEYYTYGIKSVSFTHR